MKQKIFLSSHDRNGTCEKVQSNLGFKQERPVRNYKTLPLLSKSLRVWEVTPLGGTQNSELWSGNLRTIPGQPTRSVDITAATWTAESRLPFTQSQVTRMSIRFLVDVPSIWVDVSPKVTGVRHKTGGWEWGRVGSQYEDIWVFPLRSYVIGL